MVSCNYNFAYGMIGQTNYFSNGSRNYRDNFHLNIQVNFSYK